MHFSRLQSRLISVLLPFFCMGAFAQSRTLVSISVAPSSPAIASGATLQFTATGTYSDGSTQNLTLSAAWSSSNTSSAIVGATGVATGLLPGAATISATVGSVAGSASATVSDTNLAGWWRFQDASGGSAADSSGNGNAAALENGMTWVTGQNGYAISANGTNQYASIPAVNLSSTSAVTWTAWVNRTYQSSGTGTLIENSPNFNQSTTGFGFFPDDSGDCGTANSMMTGVHGNVGYTLNCYAQPSSGVWHHIAVVYDKSQSGPNVVSLYIDGVLQTPISQLYTATNTNGFGDNPIYLFSRGGASNFLSGEMDDLRLYSQALTAAQIQQIYLQGLGTLTSIAVTPANANIAQGATQQFTATGTYSSGSPQNLTSLATWSSSNTAAATMNAAGVATGVAAGAATISAAYGAIGGSTGLTIDAPTLESITVTPANQIVSTGGTQQFTATGTYSDGSTQNLTGSVAWSSSNTAIATINTAGLATAVAHGDTIIQAVSGSVSGSTSLAVITPGATLTSIAVTPGSFTLLAGGAQQLTATGTYSDGSTQNLTTSVTWSSTNTAAATVNSSGLATAVAAGSASIQAASGSVTGSASATVLAAGSLAGWWTFDQGSGTAVADSSGNGNAAALENGMTWVTGQNGYAVSANGTNQYASIPAVNLSSTSAVTWTAWVNRTYQSSGTGTLIENSPNFNQSTTGFGFFPDDSGDCGTANSMMTGVHGNVGYTLNCYAQPSSGVWHHIAVVYDKSQSGPNVVSLYIDGVLQTPISQLYTATNTNGFGDNPIYLFSRGGASNFLSGEMDDLRLYSQALTAAQIQQIYLQGLGTLTSIAVTPANANIAQGATQQFTATGTYSSGLAANLTAAVAWSSTNVAAATISSSGLLTGVAPGSTTIQAVSGTVTGSTGLTVTTGPTLVAIAVTPGNFPLTPGGTQKLTATGTYSDGSTQNLTSFVTWSSSNNAIATVSSSGLVTAQATGGATISAVSGSVTGSAQANVLAMSGLAGWWTFDQGSGTTVADSSGNGNTATLENGMTWVTGQDGYAVSANGTNQYVSIPAVNLTSTQAVTWTAWVNRTYTSNSPATLIENSPNFNQSTTGFGFFPDDSSDCGAPGTMMAAVNGNVGYSMSCYKQPTSGTWHHIAVVYDKSQSGPNVVSLYIDGVLQAPASQPRTSTNTNTFGNNPTYLFSRGGTTNYAAGEIDDLRLYSQALTAAQIQQIYQQGLGLQSIVVTPSNATVGVGAIQQYTATGTYNNGSTVDLTNIVTWNSANPAVATISSSGLATAAATGATTIEATSGSVTGSTGLMVTASVTLVSISIAPDNISLLPGDMQQLTATGTYSDGSTRNLSSSVTWSSSSSAVATVSSTGMETAVAAGSATIQAVFNGFSASSQVTVLPVSSLAGWWKFDDGSGNIATDYSGYGNEATLFNGMTWTSGQIGEAVSANGTNQYVSIPAVNLTSTQAVTWTAWVNRTYMSNSPATLIENSPNFNQSTTGFGFFPDDSGDCGAANSMMTAVNGNVGYTMNCYAQPSSGVWHHLAVVYDKSQTGTNVIRMYIDGVLQSPTSQPRTSTNTNTFGNNPTYLFSRGGTTNFGAGEIDDLRLYSQALTAAQIQAIYQQGQGTLTSISVAPASASVEAGGSVQYTAAGTYSGGATVNITNLVAWNSTNTSVATVNASGLATGAAPGAASIQAVSGSISGSGSLSVTSAVLNSIIVTPGNQAIAAGGTQQYAATGMYSDGSTQNLTALATWSSSDSSVATIGGSGLANGVAKGTVTIQASFGGVVGSTPLTVTAAGATLQSISIRLSSVAILPNQTEQLTATGTYSDGSTQDLTNWAAWTSSNTAVATVSSTGLVTGLVAGNASIEATYNSVAGIGSIVVVPSVAKFVQFTSGDGASTTSQTTIQDHPATSGDLILAFSHWNNAAATATVQDQLGNTYTPIFQTTCVGGTDCFQVWYAQNVKGGVPLAVTITYSTQTTSLSVLDVIEYSGINQTNALDVTASATGSGAVQSSGNMPVTTSAQEMIVGLFGYSAYEAPYTAGSGFTFRNYDASTMLEDESASSTGVYSATASSSGSANWAAFAIGFRTSGPPPPGLLLSPASVIAGNQSTGTVVLSAPAPAGGTLVTLSSGMPGVASVPASVTVPAGSTSANFTIVTSAVTFTTYVPIYATVGSAQSATLTVVPQTMAQLAEDNFNRANSITLGPNWTTLVGTSVDVPMQIVNGQIESSNAGSVGKEMYYGGLNWTPDQYSQVQILAAGGGGEEGPAVRMTSNDTHYACLVTNLGAGNAEVKIVLNYQTAETVLAESLTATVSAGDVIRCTAQGATLTMTDVTSSVTLLTANDATIPAGYPGVIDYAAGVAANYVMANWSAGASAKPLNATQFAADNFNRANALDLGPNWVVGYGHGPIQIVNDQIEPYPAGGPQPSKQHYVANGPFPDDQYSELQVVFEDTVGDVAAEVRAGDTADNMYVCDVNITGPPGTAEARIVKVVNGVITTLVIDNQWSSVSPGDYIRGQAQGPLISLIDVTTGALLLTTYDTTLTSGYPGISMQAFTGNPSDHIAANWSGGSFQ
jgi:uncharacterized protein YjdB